VTRKPKIKSNNAMAKALAERVMDLEAVSLPADAATLPRQADVEVTRQGRQREGRKVDVDSARRTDAFAALRKGLAHGCYDAARRFEMDVLIRLGQSEGLAGTGRVDCTAGHTTDLSKTAGIAVDKVKARLPPRDFWLLCELIAPAIDRGTWRDHTAYVTGEEHTEGQAAVVRAATINLRDTYAAMERETAAERLGKAFQRREAA
jgi:hypothetical protein